MNGTIAIHNTGEICFWVYSKKSEELTDESLRLTINILYLTSYCQNPSLSLHLSTDIIRESLMVVVVLLTKVESPKNCALYVCDIWHHSFHINEMLLC